MAQAIPGVSESGDIEWPLLFPLRKPIPVMEEEQATLELAEPTGEHAVKYALLTRGLTDETAVSLISDLSKVPVASVKRMAAADLIRLTAVLSRFFDQAAR